MPKGEQSVPANPKLYATLREQLKRTMTWPSAYASGALVRLYKAKGGKYRRGKPHELKAKAEGGK